MSNQATHETDTSAAELVCKTTASEDHQSRCEARDRCAEDPRYTRYTDTFVMCSTTRRLSIQKTNRQRHPSRHASSEWSDVNTNWRSRRLTLDGPCAGFDCQFG